MFDSGRNSRYKNNKQEGKKSKLDDGIIDHFFEHTDLYFCILNTNFDVFFTAVGTKSSELLHYRLF